MSDSKRQVHHDSQPLPDGYEVVDFNHLPDTSNFERIGTIWQFEPNGSLRKSIHDGQRFIVVREDTAVRTGDILVMDQTRFEVIHAARPQGYVIPAGHVALSFRECSR